ncbi:hypothetical protein LDB30_13465 [Acidithiobacillus ferrooxidans]|nr:hypothetical protein LDB30_13465 [Acidithiobacillus ferrooxidans]
MCNHPEQGALEWCAIAQVWCSFWGCASAARVLYPRWMLDSGMTSVFNTLFYISFIKEACLEDEKKGGITALEAT